MSQPFLTVSYVNDHKLQGRQVEGRWEWSCPAFPSLASLHDGCTDPSECLLDFMKLCVEPSLKNRRAWEESK